jgi:hypothetical protein
MKKRFGPGVQILSRPAPDREQKVYFEELPAELQQTLRVQLRQAGEVSAVIETPRNFQLYLAQEKPPEPSRWLWSRWGSAASKRDWPNRAKVNDENNHQQAMVHTLCHGLKITSPRLNQSGSSEFLN